MVTLTDKNVNEERLTATIGDVNEIKMLGVPVYKPGTDSHSEDNRSGKSMELLK